MAISEQPFKIDGVTIPTPTVYKYSEEDLSSEQTGRTLDGVMHKDVVATKDNYSCTWKKMSWANTALIMNAVSGKTEVDFTHADPRVPDQFITGKFYIGKRDCEVINLRNSENTWTEITMTFIRI